jgi:predicted Rossmann fold nucleotide-binding protein DprA/Smf involved in DNA uptake
MGGLETVVWEALGAGAASAEVLGRRAGIPVRRVLEAVALLELKGVVQESATGEIERLALT